MGAGYWLNPATGKCVRIEATHDEWVRDSENARRIGLPRWIYDEIMQQPATAVDEIRLLALYCGLVRIREHPSYLSVQFAAVRDRAAAVIAAVVAALSDLAIHPDTYLRMDNLMLGWSISVTFDGLRSRLESHQPVFPNRENGEGDSDGKGHPFLAEIQRRFGGKANVWPVGAVDG